MISKNQYRKLCKMINLGKTLKDAAAKAGIDPKTARKHLEADTQKQPEAHTWKTRKDVFEDVWLEVETMLSAQPRLEAKTILEYLIKKYPTVFQVKHLRTLQRRVKTWKALSGEAKEVYFAQVHTPGRLGASDFTHMNELNITIQGHPFKHMLYHFVLTYSNWESVTICFSENLESLSEGLQNALWQLGGSPWNHLTDRLTAAMSNFANQPKFGARYQAILDHYEIVGTKTQPYSGNENGDAEQSHNRLKKAINQALMLRNSRDFSSVSEYRSFLRDLIIERNSARSERFQEELLCLKPLPKNRLQDSTVSSLRVGKGSTISVKKNPYSVPSRLIGEMVETRVTGATVEIWYQGHKVEEHIRLSGEKKASIKYQHVIDWLVRKPGAFENYIHKEYLFPSSTFRAAYDVLKSSNPKTYIKQYLGILKAASQDGEFRVGCIIQKLISSATLSLQLVLETLAAPSKIESITDVTVSEVDLQIYDSALLQKEVN
jgi:hypothetical protein